MRKKIKKINWRRFAPTLLGFLLFFFWIWPHYVRALFYAHLPLNYAHLPLGDKRNFLLSSKKFTLYSIQSGSIPITDDPKIDGPYGARYAKWTKGRERFHNYPVVGKVEITNLSERTAIVNAIYAGIATASGDGNYMCFDPHHAIRAQSPGRVVDFLICFYCSSIHASDNKKLVAAGISSVPNAYLNFVLTQAGASIDAPDFNKPLPGER